MTNLATIILKEPLDLTPALKQAIESLGARITNCMPEIGVLFVEAEIGTWSKIEEFPGVLWIGATPDAT